MTKAARIVLGDCSYALREFTSDVTGARWRVVYMANMALLRAVYHVLESRDVPSSAGLAKVFKAWADELWRSKPCPEIYWEFIVSERNQLLKEYSATPVQASLVHEIRFDLSTGKTENLGLIRQEYVMAEGPFAGQDQRRLIKQAIAWWHAQLDYLDRATSAA